MRGAVLVGRVNVGKSLLVVNFAAYCGQRGLRFQTAGSQDSPGQAWSLGEARRRLVSAGPHPTLDVRGVSVTLRGGGRPQAVWLWDTPGLVAGISERAEIRRAMAATLAQLARAHVVLHIVDAAAAEVWNETDQAVADWVSQQGAYAIVANKMDRPGARSGLRQLRRHKSGLALIPVSALTQQGFAALGRALAAGCAPRNP